MALLEIRDVSKSYEEPAVIGISLHLEAGHILSLLGPSGSGKTTLLRLVAGLETPDSGQIMFNDQDMRGVPPHSRRFGMMFQEFALFPHRTVKQNIAFGLEMLNVTPVERTRRVGEMLELVGLTGLADRNVSDLSGGERQRTALARSLAPQPRLLMLDEPLGALDRLLRERLLVDIRRILKTLGLTAVFVTHDQTEAFAVSDRVAVLNQGRLQQIDRPERLYRRPVNLVVARFLGFANLLHGTLHNNGGVETELGWFYPEPAFLQGISVGETVTFVVRPEAARLDDNEPDAHETAITGLILDRQFLGRCFRITVEATPSLTLSFEVPNTPEPPLAGQPVRLLINPFKTAIIKNTYLENQY
jgi:ABC-type Fe3+/spermidine/putrescine transport system ATPase subunit